MNQRWPQPHSTSGTDPASTRAERRSKTEAVAKIAAKWAGEVDRQSRIPREAVAALREAELLGFSGYTTCIRNSISTVADECRLLARSCSSTAMIYAMHHIQAACIVRHSDSKQVEVFEPLRRGDILIASCTSTRPGTPNSLQMSGDRFAIEKTVVALSYADEADCILALAPCSGGEHDSTHVLAAVFRGDYRFSSDGEWLALGMRGTASCGGAFVGRGSAEQILRDGNEIVNRETTLPVAHILLGSVWTGIAEEAVHRARLICARRGRGAAPHSLLQASVLVRRMRSLIEAAISCFEANDLAGRPGGAEFESVMNLLKIDVSTMGCEAVLAALSAGGMDCYREGTPWSIGQLLRDIASAPIMINNAAIQDRELAKIHAHPIEPFIQRPGERNG